MSAIATDLETPVTPDRAAINLANSQFSTGPKSASGKDAVKFNALKSGLFARTVVLPDEDQPAYDALAAHLEAKWRPQTDTEREIIITIQHTTWRLNRAVQLEFSLYAVTTQQHLEAMAEKFPEHSPAVQRSLAQAAAYQANTRAFDQLSRQEGRLQRALDRAKREMAALVSARVQVPPPAPATVAAMPHPQGGFVPPKYPKHMPVFTGPTAKIYRRQWLVKNGFENLT